MLQGRWFSDSDTASRPLVAIVNRTFTLKYYPGQDAVGRRFRFDVSQPLVEIVGVVDDVREGPLDGEIPAGIYTPFDQTPDSTFSIVARTEQAPRNRPHGYRPGLQVSRCCSAWLGFMESSPTP